MEERSCDFRRKMGKGGCYRGSNLGCGAVVALGFDVPAGLAQGVGRIEDGLVLGRRQLSGANVLISRLGMALAFGQILTCNCNTNIYIYIHLLLFFLISFPFFSMFFF